MKPSLIAIDLDGTLLTRAGVSDADRDAINAARDAGVESVIATGRSWSESLEALRPLEATGPMIAAGGALLHDAATGEAVLTLEGLSRDVRSVCFSADGTRIASGSSDTSVKVWDAATDGN